MKRLRRKIPAIAAIALASTGAFASAAFASPSKSKPTTASTSTSTTSGPTTTTTTTIPTATIVHGMQQTAGTAIGARNSALTAAVAAVTHNSYLSSTDRTTLLNMLNAELAGLAAVQQKIQADTTPKQATADYQTVFTQFRVFALVLPQVRFAAMADDLANGVVPKLTDAQTTLQTLLSGPDQAKDTPAVQQAMSDLSIQVSVIGPLLDGLSSSVLAFTPAQWNADPSLLSTPRSELTTVRADARTAESDVAAVVGALK